MYGKHVFKRSLVAHDEASRDSAGRQKNSADGMHMEEKWKSSEQQTSRIGYRFRAIQPLRAELVSLLSRNAKIQP